MIFLLRFLGYSPLERLGRLRSGLLLLAQRVDRANGLRQRCVEQICGSEQRGLEGTGELRQQHLAGLEVGELAYLCRRSGACHRNSRP